MKRVYLFLTALVAIVLTSCHTSREATQDELMAHKIATELIDAKTFLVKAQRLNIKQANFPSVSDATNFILVDGDNATVQVSPGMSGGPNGVGGFTVKGTVSGYESKTKSNGEVNVRFHVQAIAGSCDVTIKLIKESNSVIANISSTFRGGTATMYGTMEPIDNSVFTGKAKY